MGMDNYLKQKNTQKEMEKKYGTIKQKDSAVKHAAKHTVRKAREIAQRLNESPTIRRQNAARLAKLKKR